MPSATLPNNVDYAPPAGEGVENGVTKTNSVDLAGGYAAAIKTLTTGDPHKEVISLINENSSLREDVDTRNKQLKKVSEKMERLEAEHETEKQRHLDTYSKSREKLSEKAETLKEEKIALEAELKQQKEVIEGKERQEENMQKRINGLKGALDLSKKDIERVQKRAQDLESTAKTKVAQTKELETTLKKTLGRVSELESILQKFEARTSDLSQELERGQKRLKELEDFAEPLRQEALNDALAQLDVLWGTAQQLVESHFLTDVPDLLNQEIWPKLEKTSRFNHSLPLPQSNSTAAKRMRMAIILATLARSINELLFEPTYILEEGSGVRDLLIDQAKESSRKESHCRAVLLSIFPDEQDEKLADMAEKVIAEIMLLVEGLLPPTETAKFRSELEGFVEQATKTWWNVQRIQEKLEPAFEPSLLESNKWRMCRFEGNIANGTGSEQSLAMDEENDEPILVVFPCTCLVENGEAYPVRFGGVLRKSQTREAAKEIKEKPNRGTLGRTMSNRPRPPRPRTQSMSQANDTSPRTDTGAFLSQGSPSAGQ